MVPGLSRPARPGPSVMTALQAMLGAFLAALALAGCDQLSERAGFPGQAKVEADGKAIGGACRHAGRGLEDCFRLNKNASKAAIYAGWKEMNEYMAQNNIAVVEPTITPLALEAAKRKPNQGGEHGQAEVAEETGKAGKDDKAAKPEKAEKTDKADKTEDKKSAKHADEAGKGSAH